MKRYRVIIDEGARTDLKDATRWYNGRAEKLGDRFKQEVKLQIAGLKTNATGFAIRYMHIHCLPVENFPFMIHFSVDEINRVVKILAVIHTGRNPDIWAEKTKGS